jgi:hypothetical protein
VTNGKVVTKVVDEVWHFLRNVKVFYKRVFTCFTYTTLGLYVVFSWRRGPEDVQGNIEAFT